MLLLYRFCSIELFFCDKQFNVKPFTFNLIGFMTCWHLQNHLSLIREHPILSSFKGRLQIHFLTFYTCAGDSHLTCCDGAQLKTLKNSLSLAKQFLSRCPACYNNFLQFYCGFLCSPIQSEFMKATKTKSSPGIQKHLDKFLQCQNISSFVQNSNASRRKFSLLNWTITGQPCINTLTF